MNLAHIKHVHFVGVGGAGVGGLARIALGNGLKVTGSDATCNDVTEQLAGAGATIWIGHRRDHVAAGCGLVVASAAIDRKNPERREAERRGIRVVKYAEALGEFTGRPKLTRVAHYTSTRRRWASSPSTTPTSASPVPTERQPRPPCWRRFWSRAERTPVT